MPSSILTISGSKSNLPSGQDNIGPLTISNPSSGGARTEHALTSGNNTITVPGGGTYVGCLITKPAGNAVTLTLKGVAGDTGVGLHLTNPDVVSLAVGAVSFVLNAGGSVTVEVEWL